MRKALACQHVDSYEAGWQNWTKTFPREFQTRRGYDLTKYLPAVTGRIVGDFPTTDKFLWDFRRTIGDLYADSHYGRLAERSHQDGLGFSTEPYGGPFEFVQVGTRADFPMIEFWIPTNSEARKAAFHGVFAGRIAGRMTLKSLEKVAELLRSGATLAGSRPGDSPSLADAPRQNRCADLLRELWGDSPQPSGTRAVGQGRLLWGRPFAEILAADHLPPDFAYDDGAGLVLHAVHRHVGDDDAYFVANASPRSGWVDCRFRVSRKTPELWHPDTGHRELAALFA